METERALLIAKAVMWAGIVGALLTLLGEFLGWWNEAGEVALTITTIVGAIGGIGAIVIGSSSREVRTVHRAVEANGETLTSVDVKLDSVDGKLDSVDGKLGSVDGKLDGLETLDTVDTRLDAVQVELDRQTGVMGDQIDILREIRDRL